MVTVGDEASRRFDALQAAGEYSEAYYLHGLAVETAEAVVVAESASSDSAAPAA